MKKILFTCMSMLLILGQNVAAHNKLPIGHRNARQEAVLDLRIAQIQPAIVQSMTQEGFTNIKVVSLDISDNVHNPFYYASMGIGVTFQEPGSKDVFKLTYLYPIVYDAFSNNYYGGTVDPGYVQNGGGTDKNPDNNFCCARNCVGCATMRDQNGKTTGCGPCIPVIDDKPYSCTVENTSGMGGSRVLSALGGLLKGLITLF